MIKRVVAAILFLALAGTAGLLAGCGGTLPNDAVAKVGQSLITQKEFDARVNDFATQYASTVPDKESDPEGYKSFQLDVLDYMVTYEVVSQKAESLKVSVTDEDVQAELDAILESSFSGDQAQFDAALKEQNMTMDQLRQNYKESMLLQAAYDEITKDVPAASDADVAAYYELHKSEYLQGETRTARHILISPKAADDTSTTTSGSSSTTLAEPTQADWDAALATAEKVRADLVGGADWTAEAAQYSDDTGTKDNGGDLGAVSKGEMVAEFEASVFSLKVDEISQPVKSTYGYHVIQVTGITPAKQLTLDEKKEDIAGTLLNENKAEIWKEWLTKTKAELIVIYAAGMEPTTTTTAAPTSTSNEAATTTSVGGTTTTSGTSSSTTATTAGSSITTAAPTTTTTAKP